ncbi:YbhB/YbcL family Raf kinase inhibitor-like protein [Stetteria hydrogenophila]
MPLFGRRRRDYLVASGSRFTLESPAFGDGARIPSRYTCDGEDVSPPLRWSGAPGEARSFALIMYDPDAPVGTFIHWVIYDIPADASGLPEGVPAKERLEGLGLQGVNDFSRVGYGGPCPPRGHGAHRYYFALHALRVETLGLPPRATADEVVEAIKPHVVGHAVLMGTYER